jgi:hypothetical protein
VFRPSFEPTSDADGSDLCPDDLIFDLGLPQDPSTTSNTNFDCGPGSEPLPSLRF